MSLQLAFHESSNDTGVLSSSFLFNKFPYRNRAALYSAASFVSL